MRVIFINPEGNKNEADLTQEQLDRLRKLEGYVVVSPAARVRISISDSVCTSCEA
jgi:hypothetical protein